MLGNEVRFSRRGVNAFNHLAISSALSTVFWAQGSPIRLRGLANQQWESMLPASLCLPSAGITMFLTGVLGIKLRSHAFTELNISLGLGKQITCPNLRDGADLTLVPVLLCLREPLTTVGQPKMSTVLKGRDLAHCTQTKPWV